MYSLLSTRNSMERKLWPKQNYVNNPTARFTSSWDKQIPPTRRQAIKREDQNRTPKTLWYEPNRTPATSLN